MAAQVEDLASLNELTEATILSHLKARYNTGSIYTYVGDILLAVNPYRELDIYGAQTAANYKSVKVKSSQQPHVYYVADHAYEQMLRDKTNQAFVISGESGAGKSETTKFVIKHTMELCKAGKARLEQNIAALSPLLEAFGNAKTAMNNNSSRFGKYIEIKFDRTGAVMGAHLSEYLLEKSRVTRQNAGELNYHVFYYLFAGLSVTDLESQYGLSVPSKHRCLSGSGAPSDSEVVNSQEYEEAWTKMGETMNAMHFRPQDCDAMFRILAAILHLGDTTFSMNANDAAEISGGNIAKAAELLQVDAEALSLALTSTATETRGEVIRKHFKQEQAEDTRDACCKAMYHRVFGFIVQTCNTVLIDPEVNSVDCLSLGILDIFGFEVFTVNSLEQLCINVTNEQLQFYFNNFIFAMEQAEYAKEGVEFAKIDYKDNQPTLDLFFKKPNAIFPLLDEESRFPKATDTTFTQKLQQFKGHASGAFAPARAETELSFTLQHFAGQVKYTTQDFLEKNRDTLSENASACFIASKNELLSTCFRNALEAAASFRGRTESKRRVNTVCNGFTDSLQDLMKRLGAAKPHFVRCVKPNHAKRPNEWVEEAVTKQLRYAGVLETVQIRKMGYSVRESFAVFAKRHKIIAFEYGSKPDPTKESCEAILKAAGLKNYTFGRDKVFLKYYHADELGTQLKKHGEALQFVQKVCRGFISRVRFRHVLAAYHKQLAAVETFLGLAESLGAPIAGKMEQKNEVDEKQLAKRKFLKKMKKEAEKKAAKEAKAEAKALKKEMKVSKTKGKVVDGGHVWSRNEHLTVRVGKLPEHWEKKIDPTTGRAYFKNHKTRQTTWVDPRTAVTRKQDAKDTAGDELPYGWDEAEMDNEAYYIDHNTQTTHWLHPRLLLEEKREEYERLQEKTKARAAEHKKVVATFREKRQRLANAVATAADDDDRKDAQDRLDAMDSVIDKELKALGIVNDENSGLRSEIKVLNQQFAKSAFEAQHGKGTFEEEDVHDLYPVAKSDAMRTLPRKMDTTRRKLLRQNTSVNHLKRVPTKAYSDSMRFKSKKKNKA